MGSLLVVAVLALSLAGQATDADEALLAASRKGDLAAVKAALAKGANLEAKTRHGVTPLYFAARNGHEEVVRFLLDKGADINVADSFYKETALMSAVDEGHASVAKLMVERGCKHAASVLPMAAKEGDAGLVDAILKKGPVDAETLTSALSEATKAGKADVAETLRKAGAVEPPKADFKVDEATLQGYVGSYREERTGDLAVSLKGDKLFLTGGGPPLELAAFDKTRFRTVQYEGIRIQFTVQDGKVMGFTLKEGSETRDFKRVEGK
jgi:hypothetical protein